MIPSPCPPSAGHGGCLVLLTSAGPDREAAATDGSPTAMHAASNGAIEIASLIDGLLPSRKAAACPSGFDPRFNSCSTLDSASLEA